MNTLRYVCLFALCFLCLHTSIQAQKPSKKDYLFTLSTPYGDVEFILYEKTPKHKANFLKLVKEGFYQNLLFHRVIKDFMIQGGDPNSKDAPADKMLGEGDLGYRVDAEFVPEYFHKKGVIAAARDNNPEKASSSCQFYIVQGKKVKEADLSMIEKRNNFTYTETQKSVYQNLGGTPHLDQNYTVFGEVLKGLDIIDKIAAVETQRGDRPKLDVSFTITYKLMKKKDITKAFGYVYE